MPLKKGGSEATIAKNIEHCMSKYHDTGKVSGELVGSEGKARQICAAMAYSSARKTAGSASLISKLRKK